MQTLAHEPPFNRRALRWFRRRVADILTGALDVPHNTCDLTGAEPYFPQLLDWYCARARRYVFWTAAREYHGRGFSEGFWTVYYGDVSEDLDRARAEASRGHAAEVLAGVGSLDEWLAADLSGTLAAAPIGGSALLDPTERESLRARKAACARRARLRKSCPQCGDAWSMRIGRPEYPHDLTAKRCPDCRATKRAGKTRVAK